jgi:hypothetical protein
MFDVFEQQKPAQVMQEGQTRIWDIDLGGNCGLCNPQTDHSFAVNESGQIGPICVPHQLRSVESVSRLEYVGPVYNLETEDSTFFLEGILTHNSSHHFEHIARWEQDELWSEVFRITKPDGQIEIIVPSLDWAAAKVIDGETDEHVYNVLYGAEEAHGYRREWNTHFFGYTREVARHLAEEAGFVEVQTRDFQDDPGLGYNLYILGRKPRAQEPPAEQKPGDSTDAAGIVGADRPLGWTLTRADHHPALGRLSSRGRSRVPLVRSGPLAGDDSRAAEHSGALHRGDRHRRGSKGRRRQIVR